MHDAVVLRRLASVEPVRVAEMDRTEHIDMLYVQDGEVLVERHGSWDASPWSREGDGDHTVAAKFRELDGYVDLGGTAIGALRDGRLVGIGVVVPEVRPGIAQLAFVHVTSACRGAGVGRRLCDELERIARADGATEMVVSATPSVNIGEHGALLPRSRLRTDCCPAGRAVRGRARRCAHAQGARGSKGWIVAPCER